jgi:hypothetical protein
MARLPLLLLLAAFGPALAAQTPLTIDQFENSSLPALRTMRDKEAAHELAGLKLTERANGEHAARWQAAMPGRRAQEALTTLVDAAAFLDLPAAEIPATPAPAIEEQKRMLTQAADSVETMLHKLPDFYARRTTTHFETATPAQLLEQQQALGLHQLQDTGSIPLTAMRPARLPREELGPVDRAKPELGRIFYITDEVQTVTYADGEEVAKAAPGENSGGQGADLGLATNGEFGPILEMVLLDALQRGLQWSHWEQDSTGPLAVFAYNVPADSSHYEIASWEGKPPYFPAYRGELGVDPATGAILRITIQSFAGGQSSSGDPKPAGGPADGGVDSSILVEYAPVIIGGPTYICPVHCVVISGTHVPGPVMADAKDHPGSVEPPRFLNDVTFTGYHLFRGEVRILPSG